MILVFKSIKEEILSSLKRRYAGIESNVPLALVTILDPVFTSSVEKLTVQNLLEEKVAEVTCQKKLQKRNHL